MVNANLLNFLTICQEVLLILAAGKHYSLEN